MKATIDVKDRKEAEAIREGLADPATRALVTIMGALSGLPTERARNRVLQWVIDEVSEEQGTPKL